MDGRFDTVQSLVPISSGFLDYQSWRIGRSLGVNSARGNGEEIILMPVTIEIVFVAPLWDATAQAEALLPALVPG